MSPFFINTLMNGNYISIIILILNVRFISINSIVLA